MRGAIAFLGLALLAACGGDDGSGAPGTTTPPVTSCDGVTCSGTGVCALYEGAARCLCLPGNHAVGLTCVSDGAAFAGSCAYAPNSTCRDYNGSAYTVAWVQSGCDSPESTYSASPCVTTGLVGRCIFSYGTATETVTFFFPPNTAGDGSAACSYGTWRDW
jgi:hypothetical protein